MAHTQQREFCLSVKEKYPDMFKGVSVLDVGSLDINGNNRYLFYEGSEPTSYVGIDVGEGKNVDIVCKGHEYSPGNQFDVVISTECFEHDQHWKETVKNCIALTKPGDCSYSRVPQLADKSMVRHAPPPRTLLSHTSFLMTITGI